MEKTHPNTTKAHIHQPKEMHYNTEQTQTRFGRLLRHPAWKRRGPILILALHKFVTYLRHLPTDLQLQDPYGVPEARVSQ